MMATTSSTGKLAVPACSLASAFVVLLLATPTSGAEREPGISQWAIVGDGATESSKLVDLLTAELSKEAGLRLVEREDIHRVLDEQELSVSGLVAQAQALKLGQLLSADAFLVIEQERLVYLKVSLLQQLFGEEHDEFAGLGPDIPAKYRKLEQPEGNWNEFNYTTLGLNRSYCFNGCLAIHPRTQTPELVLLWPSNLLQRIGLDGELRILESVQSDKASVACRELVAASTAPDGIYWTKRYGAILAAVIPEVAANLPSPGVAARWHRGKLYFSYGGLHVYDPATQRTENLSRGRRLDKRNALDGTKSYWIRDIRSDRHADRLYLEIQSRELGGIWQYDPSDRTFQQVVAGDATLMHWSDGKLFFRHRTRDAFWQLLDPRTNEITALPGYQLQTVGLAAIKVGPYLITDKGHLHTADGQVHRFPNSDHRWEVMMPIENGFVAAEFDDLPARVWKFELKNPDRASNSKVVESRPAAKTEARNPEAMP